MKEVDTPGAFQTIQAETPATRLPAKRQRADVAAPSQPAAPTTPMDLLRIVTERGATPEQIAQYMDLIDRQEAKMARQAFVRAMAEFKKNPPDIYKNKTVGYEGKDGALVGYQHATLGNICEQIIGALAEHGLSHKWSIEQPNSGMIRVTCTMTHDLGHSESTMMEAPADNSGKKNPIQSIASSVTYLERYTLLAATGIAVKEQGDDDGRAAGEQARPEPVKSKLGTKGFAAALAAISAGTYEAATLRAQYDLSAEQDAELAKLAAGAR